MGKKGKSIRSAKRKLDKANAKAQRRALYASYAAKGKTVVAGTGEVAPRGKRTNSHPGWRKALQAKRRAEAEARQAERNKRSPQQQLAFLDAMLGKGVGAVRERARLQAQIK